MVGTWVITKCQPRTCTSSFSGSEGVKNFPKVMPDIQSHHSFKPLGVTSSAWNHRFKQVSWKRWPQGKRHSSASLMPSKQIGQQVATVEDGGVVFCSEFSEPMQHEPGVWLQGSRWSSPPRWSKVWENLWTWQGTKLSWWNKFSKKVVPDCSSDLFLAKSSSSSIHWISTVAGMDVDNSNVSGWR